MSQMDQTHADSLGRSHRHDTTAVEGCRHCQNQQVLDFLPVEGCGYIAVDTTYVTALYDSFRQVSSAVRERRRR